MASVVSHDLQNPLTIAQGYLDQAQSTGEAEYFDHAADALGEIREISEGVVTMARIGQQVESPDPPTPRRSSSRAGRNSTLPKRRCPSSASAR